MTDVDRDGNPDVLVDSSNTSATVLHGDGHGGVDHTSTLPLPSSAVRDLGDVTGDGLDDLILATIFNRPMQEFHIYPALATGGYAAPVVMSLPIYENMPSSIAVGDFDADGRSDLAMDQGLDNGKIHLFLQDAQGKLVQSRDILRFPGAGNVLATDLNRDGRTDLAFAHAGWRYMGYYLQTSTGLQSETIIHANQEAGRKNYLAAGDLNHDGCGDLVVSRWTESPVFVYGKGCASQALTNGPSLPRRTPGTAVQTP